MQMAEQPATRAWIVAVAFPDNGYRGHGQVLPLTQRNREEGHIARAEAVAQAMFRKRVAFRFTDNTNVRALSLFA